MKEKEKIYTCSYCNKGFHKARRLRVHERVHTNPYYCQFCNQKFARKDHQRIHEQRHIQNNDFLSNNVNMKSPLKNHTNNLESTNSALKDGTSQNFYACTYCAKNFVSEARLKIHEKLHTNPYYCQFCGQKFARKDHQRIHEQRHIKNNDFLHVELSKPS